MGKHYTYYNISLPLKENLDELYDESLVGTCANSSMRICGPPDNMYYQTCIPLEMRCPINDVQIVDLTPEI